ncbi:MAG: hypothetical protein U1F36_20920 [Planctomycetota bacterium]
MNAFHKTLALCLTLTAGLAAQGGQYDRTLDFGTADWGGNIRVAGHSNYSDVNTTLLRRVQTSDIGHLASSSLRMDGRVREAYSITCDSDASIVSDFSLATRTTSRVATIANSMAVRINGNTVFSYAGSNTAARAVDLLPLDLFGSNGYAVTVQVGPYAVTLRERATSDVNATLTPRLSTSTLTAGLNLTTQVQLEGSAFASLSALGVTVGVDSVLDFADPTCSLDLSTDFRSAVAVASWAVGTIRMNLDVFARALGLEWRLPIVHFDIPGFSGSLSAIL